jgi:hypothetical protein
LHRGDADVEERAVEFADPETFERTFELGEILADERDRSREVVRELGVWIAIERDDGSAARDDCPRVAACAVGRVEVEPTASDRQRFERFVE